MVLDQDLRYELYRAEDEKLHAKLSKNEESVNIPIYQSGFDSEYEAVRHEFIFMKDQISNGLYGVGNILIIPEYQRLFNEIMIDDVNPPIGINID